jgi:hypothetical protein
VELKQSGGQYRFEAQGYNIEGVQVQVYNLAGKAGVQRGVCGQ